jgi:ABC-2 type transport system ATP-binding protein
VLVATDPLVEVVGVTKWFAKTAVPALDCLNAHIEPGQVTGLVGPDGAGKTTLLRLLAGLLLPDEGQIKVCGFDTGGDLAGIRRVVSYMPQRFGLWSLAG